MELSTMDTVYACIILCNPIYFYHVSSKISVLFFINCAVVFVTVGGDEIETRVCALSDSVHSFKQHFFSLRGDPFNIIDISYQGMLYTHPALPAA
jgi:hypothetical protein